MTIYTQILDQYEEKIAAQFRSQLEARLSTMSQPDFEELLLQKRVLALEYFEPFYTTAITCMVSDEAKIVARGILRQEYPSRTTTHREDAVKDLQTIGISLNKILTTEPSEVTYRVIKEMRELVKFKPEYMADRSRYDVQALTALRVAGEVLAGEEFRVICSELQRRYGLTPEKSVYYWPHLGHDEKKVHLGEKGISHADKFGIELARLVDTEEKLQLAQSIMDQAFLARWKIYEV